MKNKDIPILIIGFGSIGKRHYRNLLDLGYKNIFVFDPKLGSFLENDKIKRIKSINVKILIQFRTVFICTPNHLHLETALLSAKAGCDIFIEKPLSNTLKDVSKLERIVKRKKITTMIATNMRFHPAINFIKKYLKEKKLGEVYRINLEFGHFLPYWRPGIDYKKNYAMRKNTGGGILLDGIHEHDLLFWLLDFKKPVVSHVVKSKRSNITINTEDQVSSVFLFPDNSIGTVSSDYLSQIYRRNITIIGERGNLIWNFQENIVWLETKKGRKNILTIKNYDVNEMYKKEIEYFMNCVSNKIETENNVERATFLLKAIGVK